MNLLLRPLEDPNGVTWSIIISITILLIGVAYYIYTIMKMAFEELEMPDQINQKDADQDQGTSTPETQLKMLKSQQKNLPIEFAT